MILEETVEVLITPRNITYYKNLKYKVLLNDKLIVPINHLSQHSKIKITAKCECDNQTKITYEKYLINFNRHGFYSCKKCSNKKRLLTSQEKWGVDNYMQTDECKELVEKNNIEKYGVKSTLLLQEVKDKIKKTNIEKYNTEHPLSSKYVRDKSKETFLKKYGVDHYSKSNDFKKLMSKNAKWYNYIETILKDEYELENFKLDDEKNIILNCKNNHVFKIGYKNFYQRSILYKTEICTVCNPIGTGKSGEECKLLDFIKTNYDGKIITSDRSLLNKSEIDIYLPELNIAFEFNGIYWHSSIIKDKNYHLNKTNKCLEKNIQLIHIYEDDWINKEIIVKSKILNLLNKTKLKIGARKCEIKIIDNKCAKLFCEVNHIQGGINAPINIGLYYNDELVSLMNFGKLRVNLGQRDKDGTYELLRFCNKLNTSVIGGASKLFKFFIENYKPLEIISYADRSWSVGKLYDTIGFTFNSFTSANYWYVKNKKRYNRWNFRKDILVKKGFDPNKSEYEIMIEQGYYRIYNSGNIKYIWRKIV